VIFEALSESAERRELILMEAGMLRFHRRKDGLVTIHEILVEPGRRRRHVGRRLLDVLKARTPGAVAIVAKCPADLSANGWYRKVGFVQTGAETTRSGREVNLWRLDLS
jgi:ribosomal protein S18 acetylase RimI-like enzyme